MRDRSRRDDVKKPDRGDPGRRKDEPPVPIGDPGDGEEKDLSFLSAAVHDMLNGGRPSQAAIAAAQNHRWPHGLDMSEWNGPTARHPNARNVGTRNMQPPSEAVMGNWAWFAAWARVCEVEGLIGKELGSNSLFYLITPFNCLRLAAMHLDGDDLRVVREFMRAIVTFFAVASINASRRRTSVLSTLPEMSREYDDEDSEAPTAANAGNRYTRKRNDGNAASVVVQIALRDPGSCGVDDLDTLRQIIIAGDVAAVRRVARHVNDGGWMWGVIDDPGVDPAWPTRWRWLIVRFEDAVLVVFFGPWPNGNTKPCCSLCYFTAEDGHWLRTEAWPEGWSVEIVDGEIVTRDNHGEVRVPWPDRRELWRVEIEGNRVTFTEA